MAEEDDSRGLAALADAIFAHAQDRIFRTVPPAADAAAAEAGVESLRATLDWLLSPEQSLERAVERLGLETVVLALARRHGAKAIRDALAKRSGGQKKEPALHVVRHALA